ncbi:MAG: hypothetical protein KatS3mg033_0816 [Thermonema sp.]|uniref:class I SAM-dependent methyltransferase n=1 Tax=Thermonema sp. TaxID=2231181 RepID=UPI0021DBF864|nr:class I SAM-dependent methyltransferase [Thermonema sp.]GIV39016.1 MAG: hypothetical protein KatS3mg033_0816 [Thermonema sp.]
MSETQALIDSLLHPDTQAFWQAHAGEDPFALSSRAAHYPALPVQAVAQQIERHRRVADKLPTWAASTRVLLPALLSLEQASSEQTAAFKHHLLEKYYGLQGGHGCDLTGGLGVDSFYLARAFEQWHYVEQQASLCTLAAHNFRELGQHNIQAVHADAATFLRQTPHQYTLIYLDPARRAAHRKVWALEDCSPNILELMPLLGQKARFLLVKLSPMLDLSLLEQRLSPYLQDIWVVGTAQECKEVLVWLDMAAGAPLTPRRHAVTLHATGHEVHEVRHETKHAAAVAAPQAFLYEPAPALMKCMAWQYLSQRYECKQIHPGIHLFTSPHYQEDFPGRAFRVLAQLPFDRKALAKLLPEGKAHILLRHVPLSVEQVKKKLKIKEGGERYLWVLRLEKNRLSLLLTERLK